MTAGSSPDGEPPVVIPSGVRAARDLVFALLCAMLGKDGIPRSEDSARNDNASDAGLRQACRPADAASPYAAGRSGGRLCCRGGCFQRGVARSVGLGFPSCSGASERDRGPRPAGRMISFQMTSTGLPLSRRVQAGRLRPQPRDGALSCLAPRAGGTPAPPAPRWGAVLSSAGGRRDACAPSPAMGRCSVWRRVQAGRLRPHLRAGRACGRNPAQAAYSYTRKETWSCRRDMPARYSRST